jgi:hypothetical protein
VALMTVLLMSVSHCTSADFDNTGIDRAIPALTET